MPLAAGKGWMSWRSCGHGKFLLLLMSLISLISRAACPPEQSEIVIGRFIHHERMSQT